MTTADDMQVGGDHYQLMAVQPWAAMEAWMTREQFAGFLLGNCIKYLARHGRKGSALEDLRKARHYLDKLIALSERRQQAGDDSAIRACRTCRHNSTRTPGCWCYGCNLESKLMWAPAEVTK